MGIRERFIVDIAVLTKNYKDNLEAALAASTSGAVTFRSRLRWVAASDALLEGKSVAVYFIAEGGSGVIKYQGILAEVFLYPTSDSAAVKRLLERTPETTSEEGLWGNTVKTLYSVKDIHKLSAPFHQTELLKLSDGKRVSKAYDRSYCLVAPRS